MRLALFAAAVVAAGAAPAARAQPVRIVPLGDSITQGDASHNSYRRPLINMLTGAGYDVDFVGTLTENWPMGPPPTPDFDVDHEGHWGWFADQLREDLPTWLASWDADVALLHIGTNDAFFALDPVDTAAEVSASIAALRADNDAIVVLLAQVIPLANAVQNADIVALNAELATLATTVSTAESPVILVDHYTGFEPLTLLYDGIHPNEAGEQEMADRWFAALMPVLDAMLPSGDGGVGDAGMDAGAGDAGIDAGPADAGMDGGTDDAGIATGDAGMDASTVPLGGPNPSPAGGNCVVTPGITGRPSPLWILALLGAAARRPRSSVPQP